MNRSNTLRADPGAGGRIGPDSPGAAAVYETRIVW